MEILIKDMCHVMKKILSFIPYCFLMFFLDIPIYISANLDSNYIMKNILFFIDIILFYLIIKKLIGNIIENNNKKADKNIPLIIILSIIVILIVNSIESWLTFRQIEPIPENQLYLESQIEMFPVWSIFKILVEAPILEEYIFRKVFFEKFFNNGTKISLLFVTLANGFLFALLHTTDFNISFIMYFSMSILFSFVYLYTRDIRYSMFIHFMKNFLSVI